jgi:predicted secreted acid phosphatase
MTDDAPSPTSAPPLVCLQEEVEFTDNKRMKMVFIVERSQPEDLKETIESLIEAGLSRVEKMREMLQIMEEILRRDGRFDELSREVGSYREIVFREDRCIPFTMIEARAIMSTMRKWLNAIERRLASQQV